MLHKAKDYVTWGEVTDETVLAKMIKFRGRLVGDKPIDDAAIKEKRIEVHLDHIARQSRQEGRDHVASDLKDIKPLFRLSPPKKGYEGSKRSYKVGGALGYRGKTINELIERML